MVELKHPKHPAAILRGMEPIHFFTYPRLDKVSVYPAPNKIMLIYQQPIGII
jgi:hypothetical protein